MKLTNYQRDAFVRAVMQDVPQPDYPKLQKEAQEALVKAMSPDVRKVYRKTPKALAHTYTYDLDCRQNTKLIYGDVENYEEVVKPYKQLRQARVELQSDLKRIAYGCTTLKQLQVQLPELTQYMPTEAEPIRQLPVAHNVVAELAKCGWPAPKAVAA